MKEKTDFSSIPWVKNIFESYGTNNFELVLEMLGHAEKVNLCSGNQVEAAKDHEAREKLVACFVNTLRFGHPDNMYEVFGRTCINKEQYDKNGAFLKNFSSLFSLNYDLLIYWSMLENQLKNTFRDSFSVFGDDDKKRWFNERYIATTNMWFLHGALHLRTDASGFSYKIVYDDVASILETLESDLNNSVYPVFVFEGTDAEKKYKINSNRYLTIANEAFETINGTLFTYGFSFGNNDKHIRESILKSKISNLYIGILGSEKDNDEIISIGNEIERNAYGMHADGKRAYPITIEYYDTSAFSIW